MASEAPWIYRFSRILVKAFILGIRRLQVEGIENIPVAGKLIFAANHVSLLDPVIVSMTVYPTRYAHLMAKEELFRTPGFGWLIGQCGAIPLDRHRGDVGAIRHALTILEQGGCVVLFPEGTRSKSGQPGRPRPGIGLLACLAQASVIPVRLRHTERFLSSEPLHIRFGKPVHFLGEEKRQDYEEFARRIMGEIFNL